MLIIHTLVNLQKKRKKNGVFKFFEGLCYFFPPKLHQSELCLSDGIFICSKALWTFTWVHQICCGFCMKKSKPSDKLGGWEGSLGWAMYMATSEFLFALLHTRRHHSWAVGILFSITEFLQISLKQLRKMTSLWKKSEWGSNINLINIANDVWMRIVCLSFSMMFQMLKGKLGYI